MTYQHILYDVDQKIATITLNRPDRMNAWTPIMERDVRHAMEAAAADENVRVIVLTGAGQQLTNAHPVSSTLPDVFETVLPVRTTLRYLSVPSRDSV